MDYKGIFEQACNGNVQMLVELKDDLIKQNKRMGMGRYEAKDRASNTVSFMSKLTLKK